MALRSGFGRLSFIVQLPLVSSSRMESVRAALQERSGLLHVIPFDDRPGKLFDGLQHCRSVIFLSKAAVSDNRLFTAGYQRWSSQARPQLFPQIEYAAVGHAVLQPGLFPKYAGDNEVAVFSKVRQHSEIALGRLIADRPTNDFVFYQEATQYWVKATIGLPFYAKNGIEGAPAHGRYIYLGNAQQTAAVCAILNSSLFYAYFIAYGDCFHLSHALVAGFPVPERLLQNSDLIGLGEGLQASLTANAERKTIRTRDGSGIAYAEFFASRSKLVLDQIDGVLAQHYGFTAEELDFIVNYDIKYRMGLSEGNVP